jgi:hypothetical protein
MLTGSAQGTWLEVFMSRALKVYLAVIITGFFLAPRFGDLRERFRRYRLALYVEKHIEEYRHYSLATTAAPYVRGKVVFIDENKGQIDDLSFKLPPELRAEIAGEVGTIVLLSCTESVVGNYQPIWVHATQWQCQSKITDDEEKRLVGSVRFTGSGPPPSINVDPRSPPRLVSGSRPEAEILNWICALPRR